ETDREIIAARKRFRHNREHLDSRNGAEFLLHDWQIIFRRRFTRAPWLQDHSAETKARIRDLKREARIRNVLENFSSRIGITNRVVDRRVRGRRDNSEDDALIFFWRELLGRDFRNGREHE